MTVAIAIAMRDRLLRQLPAVFQEEAPNHLGTLLAAFAQVLFGSGDTRADWGLEEHIGGLQTADGPRAATGLQRYFESGALADRGGRLAEEERAPAEFLAWLARWVALTLREDWEEDRQRFLLGHAARLYRLRGTKRGLEELLALYTKLPATVDERSTPFRVGTSRVGVDTLIGGGLPLFFQVKVDMLGEDAAQRPEHEAMVRALVDLQKPAHTDYGVKIEGIPVFKIGTSKLNEDTIVG